MDDLVAARRRPDRRLWLAGRSLGSAVICAALALVGGAYAAPAAHADVTTISVNDLRDGWDRDEPGLAPSRVAGPSFGRLFSTAVDGQVYAQPIVAGPTVVTATENNKVYGIDAVTGATHWRKTLGAPWPASAIGCADLTPNIGVTATPVYDPGSATVYVTAKVNNGSSTSHPNWYVHALDAQTGVERSGWPVKIQGHASNAGANVFNPYTAAQRPGLLLLGGAVYMGFASHCDHGPYVGWVVSVNTSSRALNLWTAESPSNSGQAGIWQSGGGLASDGPGRIFLSTGNGLSTPVGPGRPPPTQKADAVLRLQVNPNGTMNAVDIFAPSNSSTLDAQDRDLGSGGPAVLPDAQFGSSGYPHLLVEAGKAEADGNGRIWLLNRDNLGGRAQGPGGSDKVVGITILPKAGVYGHPGVWGGDTGWVYVTGANGYLQALKYSETSGKPKLSLSGHSSDKFPYASSSPVITSDGSTPGSALVWVVYNGGTHSELRAYDAVPSGGTLHLVWRSSTGGTRFTATKFATPATDSGRVYVGTKDGHLLAFGSTVPAVAHSPESSSSPSAPATGGNAVPGNPTGLPATGTTSTNSANSMPPSSSLTVTPPSKTTTSAGDTGAAPANNDTLTQPGGAAVPPASWSDSPERPVSAPANGLPAP